MGPRYYEEDEPSFRRHSTRGIGYPLSHDRDLPSGPLHISYDSRRGFQSSLHDTHNNDNTSDQDTSTRPRSRIPVACGRCRKRKIRCSGDNGVPCSNCKSAGNDECTFLRVQSTAAILKIENPAPEYYDNAAGSRMQCRMVSQGPSQYMTTHSPSTINYESYPYRNNSVPSYQQYPGKQYFASVSPFAEYDENVDYGLQTSPYQLMAPEHMQTSPNSNYGPSGQLRGWTPAPQVKSNSLFLEQEQPLYGHGQLPYNNAGNFGMRTSMGPDSKAMALGAMPILPTPISGIDRVLPNPTANRPGQMSSFLLRNNEGVVPMAQQAYQPYGGNYMSSNMLNDVKASNHNAISGNAYMPMSSTSPESIASSQIYTGSENSVNLSQHPNEIYSTHDGLHNYNTSEPSESSYGPSNGSRRESHSSRTTQHDGSLPSHSEGELSNGHHYVPYQTISANYPTPPMNIPPPSTQHPRSSIQLVQ